jgi:hypothetical protein
MGSRCLRAVTGQEEALIESMDHRSTMYTGFFGEAIEWTARGTVTEALASRVLLTCEIFEPL